MSNYIANNYLHCPKCKAELKQEKTLAQCSECDFVFYLNPAPCTTLLVEKDGKVMLTKRSIEPQIGYWDVPGGFVDLDETVEEGAIREIKEETGLDIEIIEQLGPAVPDIYGDTQVPTLNFIFLAKVVGGELKILEEISEVKWFKPADFPQKVAFENGRVALERYKQYKKGKYL